MLFYVPVLIQKETHQQSKLFKYSSTAWPYPSTNGVIQQHTELSFEQAPSSQQHATFGPRPISSCYSGPWRKCGLTEGWSCGPRSLDPLGFWKSRDRRTMHKASPHEHRKTRHSGWLWIKQVDQIWSLLIGQRTSMGHRNLLPKASETSKTTCPEWTHLELWRTHAKRDFLNAKISCGILCPINIKHHETHQHSSHWQVDKPLIPRPKRQKQRAHTEVVLLQNGRGSQNNHPRSPIAALQTARDHHQCVLWTLRPLSFSSASFTPFSRFHAGPRDIGAACFASLPLKSTQDRRTNGGACKDWEKERSSSFKIAWPKHGNLCMWLENMNTGAFLSWRRSRMLVDMLISVSSIG